MRREGPRGALIVANRFGNRSHEQCGEEAAVGTAVCPPPVVDLTLEKTLPFAEEGRIPIKGSAHDLRLLAEHFRARGPNSLPV